MLLPKEQPATSSNKLGPGHRERTLSARKRASTSRQSVRLSVRREWGYSAVFRGERCRPALDGCDGALHRQRSDGPSAGASSFG